MSHVPYGGAALIADTSAWARAAHPTVRGDWTAAMRNGQLAVCHPIVLELLYAARDHDTVLTREADLAQLRNVPVSASAQAAATHALVALSARGAGAHRVPLPDLLIAAAAQDAGLGVLHYDHHYDRLAEVLDFESRWAAPAGTL